MSSTSNRARHAHVPGLRFHVPEGWHVESAATYTSENGSAVSLTERDTAHSPSDDLARRLAAASTTLPNYALGRVRDVAIDLGGVPRQGAEAIYTWTSPGGTATERILVLATGENRVTALAFCFIGPAEEHVDAQTTFAWIAGSVT